MIKTRGSITFKVIVGYLVVAILAGLALWYIYAQIESYSKIAQSNTANNEQLILVSEITTNLNESENISRRLIQTGDEKELALYNAQIDSIRANLKELRGSYSDVKFYAELDSISVLLSSKTENLKELVVLRNSERNTNYYSQVLRELEKIDESFAQENYEERFANLEPHQRRVLIKFLEYAEKDNSEQLTNQRLDSLVTSVKKVLTEFEFANRQFRKEVIQKENALLSNDLILNQQLRKLLSGLEREERRNSVQRSQVFQRMLEKSSTILIIAGVGSILIILFFMILIVRDVTRSRQYRNQLERAKNFAESLLASREQFMAAITHDLRSPLNTVIGYSELMEKTKLSDKQNHYLKEVKKSSDYILRLVNDLLDLSKLEAGKMLIENLPFNPKHLITDTVNNVVPAETEKDIQVKIAISDEADVQVLSDPFRIKQILSNLISNAWKFTDSGAITINANLEKKIEDRHVLTIQVRDTGIGISKEKQDSIFEEFSQEDSSIEKRFGGSGLGLAITKQLTELLNGSITLESEQGQGSEFKVLIPVIKVPNSQTESETLVIPEQGKMNGKKVLVVDDEPGQLALTYELASSMGFSCETATNGKEAIKKLSTAKFDLILSDIQMPQMDGFQLIKNVKKHPEWQHIPVIALSGRTDVDANIYQKAGFHKNLLKPYKSEDLTNAIAEIFNVKAPQQKTVAPIALQNFSSAEYDLSEIFEFSGGDKDALHIIIEAFLEGSEKSLAEFKSANEEKDFEKMGKLAHRMLPMLRQMKAKKVIPVLVKLEQRQSLEEQEIDQFITSLQKLMQDLESEITV